jgi:hypothetical protein
MNGLSISEEAWVTVVMKYIDSRMDNGEIPPPKDVIRYMEDYETFTPLPKKMHNVIVEAYDRIGRRASEHAAELKRYRDSRRTNA